jgi:hypothetical protein
MILLGNILWDSSDSDPFFRIFSEISRRACIMGRKNDPAATALSYGSQVYTPDILSS